MSGGSLNGFGSGSQQQLLEDESEGLADDLRDKVKALKSVSLSAMKLTPESKASCVARVWRLCPLTE